MTAPWDDAKAFDTAWRERFERYARRFEDEALVSGWSAAGLERRVGAFLSILPGLGVPEHGRVLDLGCGAGTYARILAGMGHRVLGLDYSLPTLARALGADAEHGARYVCGDAYALPFPPGRFDLVISIGVLQALGRPRQALAEMARVLSRGGVLVVEALNRTAVATRAAAVRGWLRGRPDRVRTYAPAEVREWIGAAGLRVEQEVGLCLPPRRFPALARLLDAAPTLGLLNGFPGLVDRVAHTFLVVARSDRTAPGPRP